MAAVTIKQIEYTVEESISVISYDAETGHSLELNKISYDGREAKYDLRRWHKSEQGKRILKGVTFTFEELEALHGVLSEYLKEHGKPEN